MQHTHRRFFFSIILILGLGWIYLSRIQASPAEGPSTAPQVGFMAPDFSLPAMDGTSFTLADQRGTPVILNFWASWCPPCKAEMPALEAIYKSFQGSISIIAVNTTYQDSLDAAKAFLSENQITFPILLETDGSVNKLYQVVALPTTFFIDSSGVIQDIVIGGALTESGLRTRIESLLEKVP